MKKTLVLLAAVLFLSSLCVPTLKADGWPDPSCSTGYCIPNGGH